MARTVIYFQVTDYVIEVIPLLSPFIVRNFNLDNLIIGLYIYLCLCKNKYLKTRFFSKGSCVEL